VQKKRQGAFCMKNKKDEANKIAKYFEVVDELLAK
jgi:hypothetical protein